MLAAEGKPQEALDWLRSRLTLPGRRSESIDDDDLLVPYAHAAAELARAARDAGDSGAASPLPWPPPRRW